MGKPKKEDLNVEERLCGNVKESEGRKEVFHQTPVPRKHTAMVQIPGFCLLVLFRYGVSHR
jgi:hypothetical protein